LDRLRTAFAEATAEVERVGVRRRLAEREVAAATDALREVYTHPDGSSEALRAAREALAAAREDNEPAAWEGRLRGAQVRADRAGAAIEDYAREHLDALVAELSEAEESSRVELGRRWTALREAADRADAVEDRLWSLARLLGRETDSIGEHPLRPLFRAGSEAGLVMPSSPEAWPSRMPAWRDVPEEAAA
jgi:hypothetical protein